MSNYSVRSSYDKDRKLEIVSVVFNGEHDKWDGILEYEKKRDGYCVIFRVDVRDGIDDVDGVIDGLMRVAFNYIANDLCAPIPNCDRALKWYRDVIKKQIEEKKFVKDIDSLSWDGEKKLSHGEFDYYYFIELPVRKACRRLNEKGIRTIMSSANVLDATTSSIPEKLKDSPLFIDGGGEHFSIGNGFAWIMIDYDELLDDDKNLLDMLNSGEKDIDLLSSAKLRLANSCKINNVPFSQKELFKYYRVCDGSEYVLNHRLYYKVSPSLKNDYFDQNANLMLQYNSLRLHGDDFRAVVLRYPIDEETTIDEVVEYFDRVVSLFRGNGLIR